MQRKDPPNALARPMPLDCAYMIAVKVGPSTLIHRPQRLSLYATQPIDDSEETEDLANSYEDRVVLRK